jgi:signal-transduction protein with cAMP-binding, CBS, and nucleotidyltransferase domain
MKTGVKVGDAMTEKPVIVNPLDTIETCAKKMLENNVGNVIVKENNTLKGIITEKDFVEKVIAIGKDPKIIKAQDIMVKNLKTITADVDIYDAMQKIIKEHIRRLPVVNEEGNLIGMLTHRDILKLQPSLFDIFIENIKIKESVRKTAELKEEEVGICEDCELDRELYKINNKLVCKDCLNSEYKYLLISLL